jgi:hypothetical protein
MRIIVPAAALALALAAVLNAGGARDAHAQPSPDEQEPVPAPEPPPPPPSSAEPPPPPPTMIVDERVVSQIAGQLIPIGEHNEYLYEFRRTNLSADPLGLIIGVYGASISYGFTDNLAVRADANLFDMEGKHGTQFGVGLPIYLRRTYQGPFLEPGFIVRTFGDGDGGVENTFGPQMLFGWHWMWDSGLNLAFALGAGRNWATRDSDTVGFDDEKVFPSGYLRFGYAF